VQRPASECRGVCETCRSFIQKHPHVRSISNARGSSHATMIDSGRVTHCVPFRSSAPHREAFSAIRSRVFFVPRSRYSRFAVDPAITPRPDAENRQRLLANPPDYVSRENNPPARGEISRDHGAD